MANLRIVLTGGSSGGHIYPLVAVARALRQRISLAPPERFQDSGPAFLFLGARGSFAAAAMAEERVPVKYIAAGKWRRYFSWHNFTDIFKTPFGVLQALWHLFVFMPDAVFAKGGAASVPVVLAAWLYRIPVLIHDSDAAAGRANRFLARFASRIAIAYPSARTFFPSEKTVLTGNPVRAEITTGDAARGLAQYSLSAQKPVLLVLGGSQGAQVINKALLAILPTLLQKNIQVLHQTGSAHFDALVASVEAFGLKVGESGYTPRPFFEAAELGDALACATLVLSRAGAGSIAELAARGKAAILVPLASAANDEQRLNAYDVAALGGALVVEEPNLGEHLLLEKIEKLLADAPLRATMGEKLSVFHRPDAADKIAEGLLTLITQK